MKSRSMILFVVIALSLAVLACGGGSIAPAAEPTAKPVAPESKSGAGNVAPAAPTAAQPSAAATSAPSSSDDKPLTLTDRQAGLDKLKSYRMKWQADWKSTESGSTQSVTWNWVEEFSSKPQALHWTWQLTDSKEADKNSNIEMWQIGNTTYMSQKDTGGKVQCFSFSSEDQKNQLTKGLFSPGALGSVSNAKFAGAETVNGIKTRHYKYDEKGISLFASGKVNGDIWVAADDGYVVKEIVNWTGVAGLFGSGSNSRGDGKWAWELTDVNQPITIQAPEGCGGETSGLPVMKDATEKTQVADMVMYKTATKLADVVKFYQTEMAAAGWKAQGEPQITEQFAQLEFTKVGKTAQIMLTVDQGKTQVVITVTK